MQNRNPNYMWSSSSDDHSQMQAQVLPKLGMNNREPNGSLDTEGSPADRFNSMNGKLNRNPIDMKEIKII